jgi:ABC-type glutathione transport system ATPase component
VLRDLGAALLISTHDPRVAARFATRWVMHNGRLDTAGGEMPLAGRAARVAAPSNAIGGTR